MQHTTEIPRAGWDKFFNKFSQHHETQFVAVEVMGPDIGAQLEGRSLLLNGISPADPNKDSLALMFDSLDGEHLTHMVNKPTHLHPAPICVSIVCVIVTARISAA